MVLETTEKTEKSSLPQEEEAPISSSPRTATSPGKTTENGPYGTPATRKELWSYYAYYAGNNGIGSFQ